MYFHFRMIVGLDNAPLKLRAEAYLKAHLLYFYASGLSWFQFKALARDTKTMLFSVFRIV
jgi:hypothetical protein